MIWITRKTWIYSIVYIQYSTKVRYAAFSALRGEDEGSIANSFLFCGCKNGGEDIYNIFLAVQDWMDSRM